MSRELSVKTEIFLGAELGSALLTRERMNSQMGVIDVSPNARLSQNFPAFAAQFHTVLVGVGGHVERLQESLHLYGSLQEMLVEALDETG